MTASTRAGFNRDTGIRAWTRRLSGGRFALAELRVFASGDWFWLVNKSVAWGDKVVIGSWSEIDLPRQWQDGLPQSPYPTPKTREATPVKLVLPWPISANRYWISFYGHKAKRVFTAPSKDADAYKEECGWRAKEAGVRTPFTGPVTLNFLLVPENKICLDLDNALKVAIDALKGIVYEDDRQVYRIVAERCEADPVRGKRLEVEILPYILPFSMEEAA